MNDDPDSCSRDGRNPTIDITVLTPAWRIDLPQGAGAIARRAARAALVAAAPDAAVELSVVLADDKTLRRLNRDHRGQDRATNVLSFPAGDAGAGQGQAPRLLGDVVLGHETLRREARDQGKSLADHLAHLVVHGVLHLLGYDHDTERDAARMESVETAILAGLGIADPYRTIDGGGGAAQQRPPVPA